MCLLYCRYTSLTLVLLVSIPQDAQISEEVNGTDHKIFKRQADIYFRERTEEELDYRDHWQLGLKKAFFNTLTYVEKRITDDEKRYKLWMKIKKSRFLKRKLLMSVDEAEHNKYGVIINRNVKFEIRQTDSAIYECISKTCKPDHDVTAIWKIRTIDSDFTERDDLLPRGSEDEYHVSGSKQRNIRYRAINNRRLGRIRRHLSGNTESRSQSYSNSTRRVKRSTSEKIVDDFNIEEKLSLDKELSEEEIVRYKRNRSLFEQQNRMNNNKEQFQNQKPVQQSMHSFPMRDAMAPNSGTLAMNDPWKPVISQIFPSDGFGREFILNDPKYLEEQAREFLRARGKYQVPVNNFDNRPRTNPVTINPKVVESWNVQPVVISNEFKTPNVVKILPSAALQKEQLQFLRQSLPKNYDLSALQLEVPGNRMKDQRILVEQQYQKPNNPQFLKLPVLPTRLPETVSQESSDGLNGKPTLQPSEQLGYSNLKTNYASNMANQQNKFNKPWMSLRIQNTQGMTVENSANYAKIQTLPPKPNFENLQRQNLQFNFKQARPRLIEDTGFNLHNVPNSRFKTYEEVNLSKNTPYDKRLLQKTESNLKGDFIPNPYKIIPKPGREQPRYQSNEDEYLSYEQFRTESNGKGEHFTEPPHTQWAQLPPVNPQINQQPRSNPPVNMHPSQYQESARSRNINSYEQIDNKAGKSTLEEKPLSNEQITAGSIDDATKIPGNSIVDQYKDENAKDISTEAPVIQTTTAKNLLIENNNPVVSLNPNRGESPDTIDEFEDADVGEEAEEEDEEDYDDYEDEDYEEETDEEPQIIKTSVQHCKALAKNTLLTSRSKNIKFDIKPMLIFFKTNFDNFVKEHCYLYTTEKDLKILNNDLNLQEKKKRILRSNKNALKKRNFKKKYNLKNSKRYRNYDSNYDDNDEDLGHEVYRDSFESFGKRRGNQSKHNRYSKESDSYEPSSEIDSTKIGYKKRFTPHKSNLKYLESELDKDIVPDLESIHRLFNTHSDPSIDLDKLNLEENIQSIRRIDEGNYRIIIVPKTLLKGSVENVQLKVEDIKAETGMQSRSDDEPDVLFLEDFGGNYLKRNKKFRFPTEGTKTQTQSKDLTERVTEKFTLGDLLPSQGHEINSDRRKDQFQSFEKTTSSSFVFPQLEPFFVATKTTSDFHEANKKPGNDKISFESLTTPGNMRQTEIENINGPGNPSNKEKLFKKKGQVIDEIIYIPNHELFETSFQQPNDKQPSLFKNVFKPQSILPQRITNLENNKNITVSSQIYVGQNVDKINMDDFFRANIKDDPIDKIDISHEINGGETEKHSSVSTPIRGYQNTIKSANISSHQKEFGPVLKDGFLPIVPTVIERSSQVETFPIDTLPTAKSDTQNKTNKMHSFTNLINSTETHDHLKAQILSSNKSEQFQMNLFENGPPKLIPIVGNSANINIPLSTKTKGDMKSTDFKPSYAFTMYSDPDPYGPQEDVTIETQTEDGQSIYSSQNIVNSVTGKVNAKLQQIDDVIKIIQKDFIKIGLNKDSEEETKINEGKTINETAIDNKYLNESQLDNVTQSFTYDDVLVGTKRNTSDLIPSTNNITVKTEEDKESESNVPVNMMQLFHENGERTNENQRRGVKVSSKTSSENEKQKQTLNKESLNQWKPKNKTDEKNETTTVKSIITDKGIGQNSSKPSSNEALIRKMKEQREQLFLERNMKIHTPISRMDEDIGTEIPDYVQTDFSADTDEAHEEDSTTSESPLFYYKTVISIIEKTPVTTKAPITTEGVTDAMFTTFMPVQDHNMAADTKKLEKIFGKAGKNNTDDFLIKTNRINSKASSLLNKNANLSVTNNHNASNARQKPTYNNNHTISKNLNFQTQNRKKSSMEPKYSPLPIKHIEETENLVHKNIIAESLKSYKYNNLSKETSKTNAGKLRKTPDTINSQHLKATTFHPINFRSLGEDITSSEGLKENLGSHNTDREDQNELEEKRKLRRNAEEIKNKTRIEVNVMKRVSEV